MMLSGKFYAFSVIFIGAFVLKNGFAQQPVLSDEELKKSFGMQLNYSFTDDHSAKSKFKNFAYRNTFLRKRGENHYLTHSLNVEHNL